MIDEQQVVSGGMAPYTISDEFFQITDADNIVIMSGATIGPGLFLNAKTSALGITVAAPWVAAPDEEGDGSAATAFEPTGDELADEPHAPTRAPSATITARPE